ncbi:PspC domain-containing protein [uncultured Alistipes sp.]|jgi:phage shock protein PspC (stress-responsive transcriptional regulator)|uniref:PspC domain-containing protein n=1 Tax=uncultured Alistipes sp. TaxID=538949 RepID=UPI002612FB44|nr:PspC domain-containing protein [uncultured Alistipes sp.]
MKEVIKCSIAGVAFTLDTDAYDTLRRYLDTLNDTYRTTPDGPEIVADIEARIAELILTAQDGSRVVDLPLVRNIIAQLGTPEDISGHGESPADGTPRIPRRFYRDTANARLGGVCSGVGRYFDIDPVWIRLAFFLPLLCSFFGWIPLVGWTGPIMGNLFFIFTVCYCVAWFVVPAARSPRQKLEMNGERITAQSIRETAAASNDADRRAKPIVADAVSALGQVVLIAMKIVAGLLVFGLILTACGLIIGLFAVAVSGPELFAHSPLHDSDTWIVLLGIGIALLPVLMLIYVLMCLIASRKPGGRIVLAFFLVWMCVVAACSILAVRGNIPRRMLHRRAKIERIMQTEVVLDGDSTTVGNLLRDHERVESVLNTEEHTLRISVPDRHIDISVDKNNASVTVTEEDDDD